MFPQFRAGLSGIRQQIGLYADMLVLFHDGHTSIARGIAPKYTDGDLSAPLILNQKCIRNGWVSLGPARRMIARDVAATRKAADGDVLVNSTGTGTLGRVGRWHEGSIYVDGHVSVVKPDPGRVEPTVLAYALFDRESDIERLATGSTGQTELSPARLGSFCVTIPDSKLAKSLEETLLEVERRIDQLASESERLTELRDTLLPELLSGRIRVPQADEAA
jgi:type I restriction enzyme S subunit